MKFEQFEICSLREMWFSIRYRFKMVSNPCLVLGD